jgi:hypothetical protein
MAFDFRVTKTNSRTHPWRVELDGGEVAICWSQRIAELIATTLENDNRHAIVMGDMER